MRLWVDGQCLQTASRMRGIGRYVTDLLGAIAEHHPEVELSISFNAAMADDAVLAREAVSSFIDAANIHVWHGAAKSGEAIGGYTSERQLSEMAIVHHVNCLAPDVALSASPFEGLWDFSVPLRPSSTCVVPIVSIFYDAIPHRFKDIYLIGGLLRASYYRRLNFYPGFAQNLCISEFSKSELEEIFDKPPATNIFAGISKDFIQAEMLAKPLQDDFGEFVLYVGALDWRKNITLVVKAFREINQIWPSNELRFMMVGANPSKLVDEIAVMWKDIGLDPAHLKILGHIADAELTSLYKKASILVQPSYMEGFGLTALEAAHCGTLVVAARAGALPEIVGEDELLFDPSSPKELAALIALLLQDKEKAERLRHKLRDHASKFDWKRSADVAVAKLKELRRKGESRPTISDMRENMSSFLNLEALEPPIIARTMALAEPIESSSRLLVDATSTVRVDHKSGIQRVVRKICAALAVRESAEDNSCHFVICEDDRGWYEVDGRTLKRPDKECPLPQGSGRDRLLMLDSSWEFHALHRRRLRSARLRGAEVVSCLYDTVPMRVPALCDPGMPPIFAEWLKSALAYSTGFVCISRAVADELLALLDGIGFPRSMKVGYWQLGADFAEKLAAKDTYPTRQSPQFLMVGTLEPRKGHRVALEAFEKLWAEGSNAELVIVGKTGWGIAHLTDRIRAHPEFGKRLIWREQVDDQELATLYARCDALIASSFTEGFGLPLVEAGHFGKPVLASNIPVFREVAKGAAGARFFKAGDPTDLATSVKGFLAEKKKRSAPRASSPRWPSWAESAAQLEDVVVGGNWYRTYEPREKRPFAALSDLGQTRMTAPLVHAERARHLELIEGPYPSDNLASLKIVIAVTNLSNTVWSSRGADGGSMGVGLSYHLLDKKGGSLRYNNPRTSIPFVIVPGDTVYLPLSVPASATRRGAAFVDVELVQEGVSWFGNPLRVAL